MTVESTLTALGPSCVLEPHAFEIVKRIAGNGDLQRAMFRFSPMLSARV